MSETESNLVASFLEECRTLAQQKGVAYEDFVPLRLRETLRFTKMLLKNLKDGVYTEEPEVKDRQVKGLTEFIAALKAHFELE
jgi:hypothetical protein